MTYSLKHIATITLFFSYLTSSFLAHAQQAEVKVDIDKKEILIGQQITYDISVDTDSTNVVRFPEGQTFMPLEMVSASAIDTFRQQERYRLVKQYYLTQFDSGAYTIPSQKILVDSKVFPTDSIKIEVRSVVVDTLKQPMYGIKPIINVPNPSNKTYLWVAIIIGAILLIGFLVYWFFFRKKPLTQEEKIKLLPPFERALLGLKNLQNSKYLIESKHKEYYSQMTDIVREYLEEEVHISATESTTDELLQKIQLLQDSGKLHLSTDTVNNLKRVLKNADLVKFAKSKPSDSVAEDDRATIEQVVVKTKEALPEPTLDEISQSEAYQKELLHKKRRKKRLIISISIVAAVLLITTGTLAYFGMGYLKDSILGNTSKELVEGKWVTSDYGYPITQLSTPKVLKRKLISLPKSFESQIQSFQSFEYGSLLGGIYINTSIISFKQGVKDINPEMIAAGSLKQLEGNGAKNIITMQSEYTTARGVEGIKIYGSLEIPSQIQKGTFIKKNYELYSFNQNGALQQLLIMYNENDTYGKEIAQRVVQSIDFKTQ